PVAHCAYSLAGEWRAMSEREVVVVTGASAGLGRAIARRFARDGAAVALLARGKDGLEGARRDCERLGGKGLVIPTDVSDAAAVERAAAEVEAELGPIDIWVNNAMVSVFSPVREMLAEEYQRVTNVTYMGYVHGTLAALNRMSARDRGVIIQVSSALAYRSIPLQSAYCAAKHAILGFTASLRTELIHERSNVRVTLVHMPALNTPQFSWVKSRLPRKPQPVPPIFEPEVGADAVAWAARNDCGREISVGWPSVEAVYGNKLVPGYADRYLAKTGYASQQTNEPADPDRPNNLWEPLPGDHGAHGRFDSRAHPFSIELWLRTHRELATVVGVGLAGALLGVLPGRGNGDGGGRYLERFSRVR
ncbi:MAG TPA: SDR family oxidoreductase, partial [Gemmatimonadaceae bacterium]|nr:SDR family oxidoreductase [Gemmatimonadaceae bacterium]